MVTSKKFERMVNTMAYTIINNNPLIDTALYNPDVIVDYDSDKNRFYVTFVATNTGYFMDRSTLISKHFKYTTPIVGEILKGCETDDELEIIFTSRAYTLIPIIWLANATGSNHPAATPN